MSQEAPPVRKNARGSITLAEDEKQAIDYYNRNYRGKRYWFNAGKPEPDGKNEYRQVKETYFAACPGYHADATKK